MNANEARALLEQIKQAEVLTAIGKGECLKQIYDAEGDRQMLHEDFDVRLDEGYRVEAWDWWSREYLGVSGRTSYRYIELYDFAQSLPESHRDILPQIPQSRLLDLSYKGRREHPEFLAVLEAAPSLSARDFEVECRRLEGKTEDQAEAKTEERRKNAREAILRERRKRGQINRHVWKSEKFRKWVTKQPCILTNSAGFPREEAPNWANIIDPAHIKTKGSGGDDLCNVVPLRADLHRFQHDTSWDKLLEKYGRDRDWLYGQGERILIEYIEYLEGKK